MRAFLLLLLACSACTIATQPVTPEQEADGCRAVQAALRRRRATCALANFESPPGVCRGGANVEMCLLALERPCPTLRDMRADSFLPPSECQL